MFWAIAKGGPVMIPILLGSVLGLAIVINKLSLLLALRFNAEDFTVKVIENVRSGDTPRAVKMCEDNIKYPLAVTLKAGLEKSTASYNEIEKVMERVGIAQVNKLEKYIGGLISIIAIEPLLGFLGTITGLIKAFMIWEKSGNAVTVSQLAMGIYEAMITTATALIIAVPLFLICNFIISRIKYISQELSDSSMRLAEVIADTKGVK